jgi:prefoldin subunit 5
LLKKRLSQDGRTEYHLFDIKIVNNCFCGKGGKMKKIQKYLSRALALTVTLFGALMLTACGDDGKTNPTNLGTLPELPAEYETYGEYIEYLQDNQKTANLGTLPELPAEYETYGEYIEYLQDNQKTANLGTLPELPAEYETYGEYIEYLQDNQKTVEPEFDIVGEWEYENTEVDEGRLWLEAGYTLNGVWVGYIDKYYDGDSGKYIIDSVEYVSDDFVWVDSEYISAVRTMEIKVNIIFNGDGTFIMSLYENIVYSGYDESYTERLNPYDINYYYEDYGRGVYTVDGEKINVAVTADGEKQEGGEIEWDENDTPDEWVAYITLDKNISADGMLLTKK